MKCRNWLHSELNIASGTETEIVHMAEMVNQLIGNLSGIIYTERRKWDTKSRLLASIDRARETLGYDPSTSFEVGLHKTKEWFDDHWEDIQRDAEFPPGMSSAVKNYLFKQEKKL